MAKRKSSGGGFAVIPFLLFLIFNFTFTGGPILSILISLAIPVIIFIGIIKLIVSLTKGSSNENNKSVTTSDLLNSLSSYFTSNTELEVAENIRLICTNTANKRSLKSYDIFMDDEYVSDLEVFSNAYPGGFGNFSRLVVAKTTPKKLSKKDKKELERQEQIKKQEQALKKTEPVFEKGCAYYIEQIKRLNSRIPKENITNSLNKTTEYLQQIQKIENEFPESKTKTKKLYQHYLPMLTDILENYHRLASNTSETEDFKANEDRLSKTILLINSALKTISSSLLEEYYTDLKVDMKTLESLLKKDGLIDEMEESVKED